MLMCVWVLCAAYVSEWQKVSKLAVLTCRLAGGALEEPWTSAAPDEELGSAWNGVWFSTWSPRGSAQSCRDLDSAPLRWTFQKETVQLHRINSRLQELWRRWNTYNDTILSLRISLGDCDIKKLLIRKGEAYSFIKIMSEERLLERFRQGAWQAMTQYLVYSQLYLTHLCCRCLLHLCHPDKNRNVFQEHFGVQWL